MQRITAIILLLSLGSYTALARGEESNFYQISDAYLKELNQFNCQVIDQSIKDFTKKDNKQIQKELTEQIEKITNEIEQETNIIIKSDLELYLQSLKEMQQDKESKKFIIKTLEGLCKTARLPTHIITRSIALTNSALYHSIQLPFSTLFNFSKGLFSDRNLKELGPMDDTIYRILGPKNGSAIYILSSMAWAIPELLLHANPIVFTLTTMNMLEMLTNHQCFKMNPLDENKKRFCNRYNKLREFYHKRKQLSFKRGKKLQELIDSKVISKKSTITNERYCSYSAKKQILKAQKALARRGYYQSDSRIQNIQLILPIHKNDCTKILIQAINQESLKSLKNDFPKIVEGIEVISYFDEKYFSEFYYTQEELQSMPLENQICYDIEQSFLSSLANDPKAEAVNLIKSSLGANFLGRPNITKVILDDEKVSRGHVTNLRNIIFSIGPVEQNYSHIEKLIKDRKSIFKSIRKEINKLTSTKSFNHCLKTIEKRNINLQFLKKQSERISQIDSNPEVFKYKELIAIKKFIKKQRFKLKMNWELVPTNNLEDIIEASKSNDVGNIIVIAHGKKTGHLVDSYGQEMPNTAFNNLSPTIMSLNFYSCYSKELLDRYDLLRKMQSSDSYYKIRFATNVQENDFMGSDSFAPIAAFGDYLVNLDANLYLATKGARALQKVMSNELSERNYHNKCTINVSDIHIKNGSYSIAINKEHIGILNEFNDHNELEFPCKLINDEDENQVTIKNITSSGGSEIKNLEDFSIRINGKILHSKDAVLKLQSYIKIKFSI